MSLRILGASAGSGKTHRLSREVTSALAPDAAAGVRPDGLVAVTYTRKAEAELAARIRQVLVGAGAFEEALRLPLAYLGTVHAVCMRIVGEFALDAGLSPELEVLPPELATAMLRQALERELEPAFRAAMLARSLRLEIEYDSRTRRADWMKDVDAIMKLARSNRIGPEALAAMGQRSARGLLGLLPKPAPDGARLDTALRKELLAARTALEKSQDGHGVTAEALKVLRDTERRLARGAPLAWHRWVTLAKVKPAKACVPMVARLNAAAAAYERHPALHEDLRAHTEAVFEAAARGLRAYTRWKAERRYVDYEDMIDRALDLVETPAIASILGERLQFLAVDEFQDTSPIQLALFVRLAELAGRSVWVGDRKQCIFEYAGADPVLMEAVTAWVHADGRKREMLGHNYRSRPGLVKSISQLFAAALARHDYTKEEVAVEAVRKDPKELAALPCFGAWWLAAARKSEEADAIAAGVRRLLAEPAATPVLDRESGAVRPLRPGDIAILTATNDEAAALAAALERLGIPSALEQNGLLARPEGALVQAGLRLLLDPRDRLALAELEALRGFGGKTQAAWLADRLTAAAARRRGDAPPASDDAAPTDGLADVLAPLRARLDALSPAEAVDGILGALDATTLAARWPEPERRRANLDALRALAAAYEEACAQEREAATLAGLLRYFAASAGESDAEHAGSETSAVQLSTYHKAKGLEWPVVILASLDRREKRSVFDVAPETDKKDFDPSRPLDGRWIRFWPWPFGSQQQVPLATAADASREGLAVAAREDHELVRLLYVGFTRARDHLVLAATLRNGTPKVHWLDHLRDDADPKPLLELPTAPESKKRQRLVIRGSDDAPVVRVWHLEPAAPDAEKLTRTELHAEFERPAGGGEVANLPAYRLAPSRAATEWPGLGEARVVATTRLAGRTPLVKSADVAWDTVGTAVHAFLAADLPERPEDARVEMASRLLEAAELVAVLRPEALVAASDALAAFVATRFPGARWRREVPIAAVLDAPGGRRRVEGVIDLLLETPEGVVVIDHKSYPGAPSTWEKKALEHAPQLAAYAEALRMVEGVTVRGCFVHFTLGGGLVELRA